MRRLFVSCSILLLLSSCATQKEITKSGLDPNTKDLMNAVAWTQNAGEHDALTLQAFYLAKIRLNQILKEDQTSKPKAIVLDIDETVLDNSPYEAYQILNQKAFSQKDWQDWTSLAAAKPLAGAIDFLNYTQSRGVQIFYLSNRLEVERSATLKNLKDTGFPDADNEHLILKTTTSSKKSRRADLARNYNIILFFGDNLSDFSDIYYYENLDKSAIEKVRENPEVFGSKYIVLPNPMYGDWETSMYKENKNKKITNEQVKINSLRSFKNKN